jgi:predicted nucleic acid-binding protein
VSGVLVDSNVLLDVALEDTNWFSWSSAALAQAADSGPLVINSIIFAEISVNYDHIDDLERVVPSDAYVREALPFEAAFLAGKAFLQYRRRGGVRTSPLPDFFIGAHAAITGYSLLTRDPARFRTHFPRLALIAPDSLRSPSD